jgi:signal transduction histidine kinase
LHRKIFLWFGAAILLMGTATASVAHLIVRSEMGWNRDHVSEFVSERFGRVWGDSAQRDELLESISRTFHARLQLVGSEGQELSAVGGKCLRAQHRVPVKQHGTLLGYVAYCGPTAPHSLAFRVVMFALFGCVFWLASGFVAQRIARPLQELTRVARRIGDGKLDTRVEFRRPQRDEVGELGAAINDMAARIEKQVKDQRELLAAVSHEIRTPLAHLRVLLDLLERDGISKERHAQLACEVEAIDGLVAELLANSRVEFQALDLRLLRAADFALSVLERTRISPELLSDETENIQFSGDPTLLSRALCNLFDNARKHGGGMVAFRLRRLHDSSEVVFEVEDNGAGFVDNLATQAFEPFVRGETANATDGSLGLGLALVKRIAEAHGGRAWASNLASGARVSIALPLPSQTTR